MTTLTGFYSGPALFTAGFRPFYLGAALWAALAVPLWLGAYGAGLILPSAFPPLIWHAHEMIFGYGAAVMAGVLMLSLQGRLLVALTAIWIAGRIAMLLSAQIGAPLAAVIDLAFPAAFLAILAEEIIAMRHWVNLPILLALATFFSGDVLVHLSALRLLETAALGIRIGLATLLFVIALVGGRIIPDVTRRWLAKYRRGIEFPASPNAFDHAALVITLFGVVAWAITPQDRITSWALVAGGAAVLLRLARWRGLSAWREPLIAILHIGYGWLGIGFVLLGAVKFWVFLPSTAALHALTAGAIGTMTLAVMTRATREHTGQDLSADRVTCAIYLLVTAAALLRVVAPLAGSSRFQVLWIAGGMWSAAFTLFTISYGGLLLHSHRAVQPARRSTK